VCASVRRLNSISQWEAEERMMDGWTVDVAAANDCSHTHPWSTGLVDTDTGGHGQLWGGRDSLLLSTLLIN
jgi:hypothetical protein